MSYAIALLTTLALGACAIDYDDPDGPEGPAPVAGTEGPWFEAACSAPAQARDWDQAGSLFSAVGDPNHGASDVATNPGAAANAVAHFTYGVFAKDLEDETIDLWIETAPCQWELVSTAVTDESGAASLEVPAWTVPREGTIRFEAVAADRSRASGRVWVLPRGAPLVVFDIDGTLTTGDSELVEDLLGGEDPDIRPGAAPLADYWADRGQLIYATARPHFLDDSTERWLRERSLPPAPVFTSADLGESLAGAEDFKADVLLDLSERVGLEIHTAYGNAATDICAYARAGIDPASTFIVGDLGGDACDGYPATMAVEDYPSHLADLPD